MARVSKLNLNSDVIGEDDEKILCDKADMLRNVEGKGGVEVVRGTGSTPGPCARLSLLLVSAWFSLRWGCFVELRHFPKENSRHIFSQLHVYISNITQCAETRDYCHL